MHLIKSVMYFLIHLRIQKQSESLSHAIKAKGIV